MSENEQPFPEVEQTHVPVKPRSRLRRLGCWIGLAIWLVLLLLPCFMIALIAQGEIAIQLGNVPGQSFRVWLIQDATERGLGIARPSIHSNNDNSNVCLQTDTNFLMWMGKGDSTSYCECFTHDGDSWKSINSAQGSCNP